MVIAHRVPPGVTKYKSKRNAKEMDIVYIGNFSYLADCPCFDSRLLDS